MSSPALVPEFLVLALAIEGMATATDEIIDLHDRIPGKLFNAAKQNGISGAINSNGLIVHFRLRQNKYC